MIKQNMVDVEYIFELLHTEEFIKEPAIPEKPVDGPGLITFQNVSFSYDSDKPIEDKQMILDNLSLTIRAGESTAIVGSTGSGKSTIMRLIYRFYDTDEGTILIDGQDIRNITIDDLRQKIAIVPQDCVLFNDTLRYNIAYGGVKDPEINKLMNDPDRQEELEAKIIATAKKA